MYERFGKMPGEKCGTCKNLVSHLYDKRYYKCTCYGESSSIATDWAKRWDACGLHNKDYNGRLGIWFVKHSPRPKGEHAEIEGQERMWEG